MRKSRVYFLLFISLFFCHSVKAHHGGEGLSGINVAGPIITIPAYTLPKGLSFIDIRSDYTNFDTFSDRELANFGKRGEHIHDINHLFIPSLAIGHGFTDDLTIGIRLPYIFRFGIKDVHEGNVGKEGNSIGIGDISFFEQYRFLNNKKYNLSAAVLSGIKIPSGVRRTKSNDGLLFEADEQPGSGSWDPFVGLAVSKILKGFSLDTNGLYKFATRGSQDSNLGNIVSYNFSISHCLFRDGFFCFNKGQNKLFYFKKFSLDSILEANGTWSEKPNTVRGFVDENHGGNLIYLSPGFRLTYDKKWIWSFSMGFPVIENLNGIQRAPNFRLVTGITRAF